jgi:adenine-specific DNA-methyltransferase
MEIQHPRESDLGKPFYETDQCVLYYGDSLVGLEAIRSESVNLTITSPPYNIGKEYETPIDLEGYLQWTTKWIRKAHNCTSADGALWLNLGYVAIPRVARAIPLPYLIWQSVPFYLVQEVVWNYGAGVAARRVLSPRNEKWLWYVKNEANYTFNLDAIRDPDVKYPHQKKHGKLRCNTVGKNPSDVWQIAKVTSGDQRSSPERTRHPAQFPEDLVARIVRGFSNRGDVILDPFFGSGTTAVVALREGRRFVGFEISKDYCELARDRIKADIKQRYLERSQSSFLK